MNLIYYLPIYLLRVQFGCKKLATAFLVAVFMLALVSVDQVEGQKGFTYQDMSTVACKLRGGTCFTYHNRKSDFHFKKKASYTTL